MTADTPKRGHRGDRAADGSDADVDIDGYRWLFGHVAGFWIVAAAFLVVMAFSTVPTPLYAIYQARDGFSSVVVTLIFAAYAAGVVVSLFLVGHISDWAGRRRMILAAIVTEIIAAAVFLIWPQVPGLLTARFVTGLGVGALTATATAHLGELKSAARSDEGPDNTDAIANVANIGGLALGPLIGGLFAQYTGIPLIAPYLTFLALLVVAGFAVAFVPETVADRPEPTRYRPQRIAVPHESRAAFWSAGLGAFAAFAVFGLFTSLAPTFLAATFHVTDRLVAGAVTFAVFAAAVIAQLTFARAGLRTQIVIGTAAMAAGLAVLAVGAVLGWLPLFVVGGIVAGAGVGIVFRSALQRIGSLAPPERRGEILAAAFLIAYTGLTIPVILIGAALLVWPPIAVLLGFAAAVAVLALVAGVRMADVRMRGS